MCISYSNVPQLRWGTLQIEIIDFGSKPDLYEPEINMKMVNSSYRCLSCVEIGEE
jgi:hypothetical protein